MSKTNIIVSRRGQITLPSELRQRFGIREGGVVTLEERNDELILRPAAVVELELYTDDEIARWDKEDLISESDKRRIKKRLRQRS